MTVQEIMTREPQCCTPDTQIQQVARMMVECDCGAIPVVENTDSMKPVGIITDRDIVTRILASGDDYRQLGASAAMTPSTVTVQEDANLNEAERLMKERQIRRIIAVDENGRCVGIVAQADIARHRSDSETGEIVEEISEPATAEMHA